MVKATTDEMDQDEIAGDNSPAAARAIRKRMERLQRAEGADIFTYLYRFEGEKGSKKISVGRIDGPDVDEYEIGTRFGGPALYEGIIKWKFQQDPPDGMEKVGIVATVLFRIGEEYGSPEEKLQQRKRPGVSEDSSDPGIRHISSTLALLDGLAQISERMMNARGNTNSLGGLDMSEITKTFMKNVGTMLEGQSRLISRHGGTMEAPAGASGANDTAPGDFDLGKMLGPLLSNMLKDSVGPMMKNIFGEFIKNMGPKP